MKTFTRFVIGMLFIMLAANVISAQEEAPPCAMNYDQQIPLITPADPQGITYEKPQVITCKGEFTHNHLMYGNHHYAAITVDHAGEWYTTPWLALDSTSFPSMLLRDALVEIGDYDGAKIPTLVVTFQSESINNSSNVSGISFFAVYALIKSGSGNEARLIESGTISARNTLIAFPFSNPDQASENRMNTAVLCLVSGQNQSQPVHGTLAVCEKLMLEIDGDPYLKPVLEGALGNYTRAALANIGARPRE